MLSADLKMFTGTEQWFRHPLSSNFLYTDGVKFFTEHCGGGALWFLDILATELADLQETEDFMSIVLIVVDKSAKILVDDGNGNILYTREVDYTDAEEGAWKFFFTNNVLLLPSEY